MKKLSFLFIALSLVAFISLNSCKTSTKPVTDETEVVEEEMAEEAVDTAVVADTVQAVVEEAATE